MLKPTTESRSARQVAALHKRLNQAIITHYCHMEKY